MLLRTDYKLGPSHLQIGVIFVREGHVSGFLHLLVILIKKRLVDGGGWRSKGGSSNEFLPLC